MEIKALGLNAEDLPKDLEVEMPEGVDAAHIEALKESISSEILYNARDNEMGFNKVEIVVIEQKPHSVVVRVSSTKN
jgi:hypothetical protein